MRGLSEKQQAASPWVRTYYPGFVGISNANELSSWDQGLWYTHIHTHTFLAMDCLGWHPCARHRGRSQGRGLMSVSRRVEKNAAPRDVKKITQKRKTGGQGTNGARNQWDTTHTTHAQHTHTTHTTHITDTLDTRQITQTKHTTHAHIKHTPHQDTPDQTKPDL